VRVKSPAQEDKIMSPARTRTRTARSEDERTNEQTIAKVMETEVPIILTTGEEMKMLKRWEY